MIQGERAHKIDVWYVPVVLQLQSVSQTDNFTLQLGHKKLSGASLSLIFFQQKGSCPRD